MKTLSAALLAALLGLTGWFGLPGGAVQEPPSSSPGAVLLGVGCCKNAQ